MVTPALMTWLTRITRFNVSLLVSSFHAFFLLVYISYLSLFPLAFHHF